MIAFNMSGPRRYSETLPEKEMRTPWGDSQQSSRIAEGIINISTASHGGIRLSPERQAKVARLFPRFISFAGGAWYEEDCDVAVVAIVFPESFSDAVIRAAVNSAHTLAESERTENARRRNGWKCVSDWLKTPAADEINARVQTYEQENANNWEVGSSCIPGSCTGSSGWEVLLTRLHDGEKKTVQMPSYPSKQFFTDEELAGLHRPDNATPN